MLRKSDDQVRECYRLASLAREQAMRNSDPACKAAFFRIEDCWIGLAQSYQLVESLSDLDGDISHQFPERT